MFLVNLTIRSYKNFKKSAFFPAARPVLRQKLPFLPTAAQKSARRETLPEASRQSPSLRGAAENSLLYLAAFLIHEDGVDALGEDIQSVREQFPDEGRIQPQRPHRDPGAVGLLHHGKQCAADFRRIDVAL